MRILIFTRFYLPAFKAGGPIQTISNLVTAIGDEFEIRIITTDRDSTDKLKFSNIETDNWQKVGKAYVYYSSPKNISYSKFSNLINDTPHDVIYLNSFFDLHFSIFPLIYKKWSNDKKTPVILAPRGEFSSGAIEIKSLKKRIYIIFANILNFYKNIIWQASSEFEKLDILNVLGKTAPNIIIAPNIPATLIKRDYYPNFENKNELKIIFLSRISPKKNLIFALNVLRNLSVNIKFSIYGIISDSFYWNICLKIIDQLPENIKVEYKGAVEHEYVQDEMIKNHLFFLPTKGENYGHVIAEALSAGIPVLISEETPWRNLSKHGVGWDIALEKPELFNKTIENYYNRIINRDPISREYIFKWISEKLNDPQIIESNKQLFLSAKR